MWNSNSAKHINKEVQRGSQHGGADGQNQSLPSDRQTRFFFSQTKTKPEIYFDK